MSKEYGKIGIFDDNELWSMLEKYLDSNWVLILGDVGMNIIENGVYTPGTSKNENFILIFTSFKTFPYPPFPIGIGKKTKELKEFIETESGEVITQQEFDNLVAIYIKGKVEREDSIRCLLLIELIGYNWKIPNTSFKGHCKKYIDYLKRNLESGNITTQPPEDVLEFFAKAKTEKYWKDIDVKRKFREQ